MLCGHSSLILPSGIDCCTPTEAALLPTHTMEPTEVSDRLQGGTSTMYLSLQPEDWLQKESTIRVGLARAGGLARDSRSQIGEKFAAEFQSM